jgi:hypothetical protein
MSVLKTRIILGTAMLIAFCGIIYIDYAFDSDIGIGHADCVLRYNLY